MPLRFKDVEPEYEKGQMPPGGCPAWDDAFMAWVRNYTEEVNLQWLDSFEHGRLPSKDLLRVWQLVNHLAKFLIGFEVADGQGHNYTHKIRYVAIQYHYREPEIVAEAERYIRHLQRLESR